MKKLYFLALICFVGLTSFAQQINEFEPNPVGTDPANVSFELLGTPSASFSGWILSLECDPTSIGTVDRAAAVSGTFDANGLLVVMVPDLENPSYTVVLTDDFTGTEGATDIDTDDDGVIDDLSTFGTVLDAIGIPDNTGDEANLYGASLGGQDFAYTGDEPGLVFRDGTTGEWYAINDPAGTDAYDINANPFPQSSFDADPTMTTYGAANPSYVPPACGVILGGITYTCDTVSAGDTSDTVTIEISYTGSDAGITSIDVTPMSGTVGGDDPAVVANGTITITGLFEGDAWDITLNGGDCNGDMTSGTIPLAFCTPIPTLPISDDFTYADGSLVGNGEWTNHSGNLGDLLVASGQAVVQHGTPSEDANLEFQPVSGDIYFAFDFSVDDLGMPYSNVGTDFEYFAHLMASGGSFSARVDIVPPSASGDYSVGIGSVSSTADATWATDLMYDTTYRVTVRYNQDTNIAELWINASSESDTSILGADETDPGNSITQFALRQSDSDENETIRVDNLIISETFDGTLSVENVVADEFKMFPNPNSNGLLNISVPNGETVNVAIYDVLGKQVLAKNEIRENVNVSNLNSGLYIVKLSQGNSTITKKLIIK